MTFPPTHDIWQGKGAKSEMNDLLEAGLKGAK